jgi:putative transposase
MSEKFELIAAEKADPTSRCPVIKMCAWLGVSTSGFYDHCNAVETDRARRRTKIITHVQAAYRLAAALTGCAACMRCWPAARTRRSLRCR